MSRIPWLRLAISFLIGILGLWLITRNTDPGDIRAALEAADTGLIFLSVGTVLGVIFMKTGRWQLIFSPRSTAPSFAPLFWALVLGQFINVLIPLRLGEVARIYALDQQASSGKARTFSTLVIEKTLDITALILSMVLLLPFLVIPDFVTEQGYPLALVALVILAILLIMASQTDVILGWVRRLSSRLPSLLVRLVLRLLIAGLEGLSALRNWRLTLVLGLASALIVAVSVLTPLLLFQAFHLPLGLKEAVFLNLVLSIGSAPPSTPGKVLIFEALVAFTLRQFGLTDNAMILSFAIIFHLVVVIPQVALGSLAAARGRYRLPAMSGQITK